MVNGYSFDLSYSLKDRRFNSLHGFEFSIYASNFTCYAACVSNKAFTKPLHQTFNKYLTQA